MPENTLYLGWIATLFPLAILIHCRRDLRDVACSCWMTHLAHVRWACDPDHIATRINDHLRLMDHWHQVLPIPILEVDYESLVANPEREARELVAWCGLDWDPACLNFHENRRPSEQQAPPRFASRSIPARSADGRTMKGRSRHYLRRSRKSRGHEPTSDDDAPPWGGRRMDLGPANSASRTGCRFGPQEPASGSKTPAHGVWQPGHVP